MDEQWQADLADMRSISKHNENYKCILTCIDILSKYAWAVPLKSKTGQALVDAFELIFKDGRKPMKINTNQDTKFENTVFKSFVKHHKIYFFTTRSDMKASVVERFNRTLKTKMWRYFTARNTYRYIDVLKDLLFSYNNSNHRSIVIAPSSVTKENENVIWQKLYGDIRPKRVTYKYEVGDSVRISRAKAVFEKGYVINWTEEIFTIAKRIPRDPVVYKIKDYKGEVLEGLIYEAELQKVTPKTHEDTYVVEKVLQKKTIGRKKLVLVKWRGYPSSMNSYFPESELIQI